MRTQIEIKSEKPEKLDNILTPSLKSRGKVEINTEARSKVYAVEIETEGLGPLRGTTDNVFRLSSLAKKITED